MVTARGLVTVFLLVQTVFGLQWYAKYDLSQCHIDILKTQGCYRGLYGGLVNNTSPRTLSLVTCAAHITPPEEPFAVTDDDAFLCVVELKHNVSIESAEEVADRLGAKILFRGRQELVLANPLVPSELHEACFLDQFPGIAAHVLYVPRDPEMPLRPCPEDHPVYERFGPGKNPAPNQRIVSLLNTLSQTNIQNQDVWLSTDNSGATGPGSKITRNSYAINAQCPTGWKCPKNVLDYITSQINTNFASYTGKKPVIERKAFRADMCENLIVTIPGMVNTVRHVVAGAHVDSRSALANKPDAPSPGADDNGTGSAMLLELARAIGVGSFTFDFSIQFVWFCGEEQGLLGSAALAKADQAAGKQIIAMFNADMLGWVYRPPTGAARSVLTFTTDKVSIALTDTCKAASRLYNPNQEIGDSKGCCSDAQSYFNYGFPAAEIFETPTLDVQYPYYHRETDTSSQVNFPQVYSFAKSFMACIAEHAVPR
jgi:hypothetical protein